MRYCKGCGFPVPYGKFLGWTEDGTIIGRDSAHTRLVYLEVEELRSLYDGVSRWMNYSIDPIVCRAEKDVGKSFIKTLMPGFMAKLPRGKVARPEMAIRASSKFIFNYMSGLGMGHAELIEYASGSHARVLVVNPHVIALIAGDGCGVFESMERVGVTTGWERVKSDEYIITIYKNGESPAEEKVFVPGREQYVPGSVRLSKCDKCGVPLDVTGNIYLDLDKGVLRHSKTGMRFVALPVNSFNAVMQGLEAEIGSELPGLMQGLEQKYMRETSAVRYSIAPGRPALDILSDFAWSGIGNPVAAWTEGRKVHFVVENPFHPGIVAGKVTGLYEAWTGSIVRTSWIEESPGRAQVTLERVT